MLTNERVQRLIETDRETLVLLMAFAYANGSHSSGWLEGWNDADVRALMNAARAHSAARVVTSKALDDWNQWAAGR